MTPIDDSGVGRPLAAVTERAQLDVVPEDPLTLDRLLRRLEVVRQRLAVRWCGTEGAFSGYDRLDVACTETLTSGVVTFSASLVSVGQGSHTVELVASVASPSQGQAAPVGPRVLARGEGRTLEVHCSSRESMNALVPDPARSGSARLTAAR